MMIFIETKRSNGNWRKSSMLLLLLFFFTKPTFAQIPTQTIRGIVQDQDTEKPLIGATIELLDTDPAIGTTTGDNGQFRFENVEVGRYQLKVSYLGYSTLFINEVLLESGKETVLELKLQQSQTPLSEIVVKGKRTSAEQISPTSSYILTLEETLRFPASFYDPARLAANFAGVVNTNDQTNNISIRGNSPNHLSWRLEGVEIVNPNHTSNAGTFSDRSTQNGGGVNMLSAQLLGTSHFLTGAFPARYGNVLSGVMDMRFRNGNNQRNEFTAQIGLIGIDLAAEGPLSKTSGSSFLVNYRYSTIGLLNALGVELGDEAIAFQDLAFHLNLPTKNTGQFTVFGVGGSSENIFEADRDSSTWEFQKDRFDIVFDSRMGLIGATHTLPVGQGSVWKSVIALSGVENNRTGDRLDDELVLVEQEKDTYQERKIAFSSTLNHKLNSRNRIQTGIYLTNLDYEIFAFSQANTQDLNGSGNGHLIQPFVNFQSQLSQNLSFDGGLRYQYFTFNESSSLEPRASLQLTLPKSQNLSLAYGLHSQLQLPQLYFADIEGGNPNENLDFTRAHHLVLSYQKNLNLSSSIKAELYYQSLFDVPIIDVPRSSFSALNLLEGFVTDTLTNAGKGENYGLELSYSKSFTDDYFLLINGTFYESKYTGGDGIQRDTRFNGNYIFNLTAGKEFRWDKNGKNKILGINGRLAYIGGFRDTPIDIAASQASGETVYLESEAFSIRQDDFFKVDLRIYYKRNKTKYSSTVALDIQNASNAQNAAFSYFDTQKGEIVQKYQLGLIPILSYRVEF